eukprot:gene27381-9681_t
MGAQVNLRAAVTVMSVLRSAMTHVGATAGGEVGRTVGAVGFTDGAVDGATGDVLGHASTPHTRARPWSKCAHAPLVTIAHAPPPIRCAAVNRHPSEHPQQLSRRVQTKSVGAPLGAAVGGTLGREVDGGSVGAADGAAVGICVAGDGVGSAAGGCEEEDDEG